jgi:hypothetical protein
MLQARRSRSYLTKSLGELLLCFISALATAISLRVIGRQALVLDSCHQHKLFPEFRNKKFVMVENDFKWQTILAVPIFKEEDSTVFC